MDWVPLKTYLIPSIAAEIKSISLTYHDNVNNISRHNGNRENDTIQDYVLLRSSIKARIEEMSEFYENHINDPKIHFIEKYRLKLKQ